MAKNDILQITGQTRINLTLRPHIIDRRYADIPNSLATDCTALLNNDTQSAGNETICMLRDK
jgi:hypothetical protein